MKRGFVAVVMAASLLTLGAAAGGESSSLEYASSASGVISRVHQRGASAVVAELFSHKVVWEGLLENVELADAQWLKAAAALRPGAEKGAAAELTDSVRLALMIDAKAVLANAIPAFSVAEVCSADQQASRSSSSMRSEEIVIRQIRAVKIVRGGHLAGLRKRCLARLEASRKALETASGAR